MTRAITQERLSAIKLIVLAIAAEFQREQSIGFRS